MTVLQLLSPQAKTPMRKTMDSARQMTREDYLAEAKAMTNIFAKRARKRK
jgi:hypothetical protein